ncbi:hypothetical protein H2200_005328 [Cladophialophora chaetospira]|uniref:Restriction of telomere capping protein 4 n=1 Tax=Cladophialophora chaetospira TaxID=386627 RepID=A0AA38XBZ4_9EURO|nr:hypothetical protein H2200_005328 [Cladophialophora chaetospira]
MSPNGEVQPKESDKHQDDLSVMAPPLSSDDEIEEIPKTAAASSKRPTKDGRGQPTNTAAKRSAGTAASSRTKRQKLTNQQSLEDINISAQVASTEGDLDIFGMPSSSSQRKRQKYTSKSFKSEPLEEDVKPVEKKAAFKAPDAVEMHTKSVPRTQFQSIDEPSPVRKRATRGQQKFVPVSPEAVPKPIRSEFRTFDLPDFPSSNGTENPSIPDIFDSPAQDRKRSGSTSTSSSLSSVDSLLLLAQNDEYRTEVELESTQSLCPVCDKPVHSYVALVVPKNLRTLPFQQQQKFCSQHKIADAKEQWQKRLYPKKIYWEELEGFRIREKLPNLKKVITRQTPSFYLEELDTQIKTAKGNRRKIRNYLNEGIINIAKAGYYGPKGARIMTNAVTPLLTETLNKALQSDSALRAAGVGGYVSAVLVPELTLQLVMEDMNLKSAKEGRRVLEESTDIGVLLNPDDDQVQQDTTEDE